MKHSIIKALAGLSQRKCSRDSSGFELIIFADGSIHESPSPGSTLARGNGDDWEYPILRINRPMTMAEIRAAIS